MQRSRISMDRMLASEAGDLGSTPNGSTTLGLRRQNFFTRGIARPPEDDDADDGVATRGTQQGVTDINPVSHGRHDHAREGE